MDNANSKATHATSGGLMASLVFIPACTRQQDFPQDARQALEERILALADSSPADIHIARA